MANNNERRWSVPSKRAKGYAEERKAKVHQHGPKEGKELTDYEAYEVGLSSGSVRSRGAFQVQKGFSRGQDQGGSKKDFQTER